MPISIGSDGSVSGGTLGSNSGNSGGYEPNYDWDPSKFTSDESVISAYDDGFGSDFDRDFNDAQMADAANRAGVDYGGNNADYTSKEAYASTVTRDSSPDLTGASDAVVDAEFERMSEFMDAFDKAAEDSGNFNVTTYDERVVSYGRAGEKALKTSAEDAYVYARASDMDLSPFGVPAAPREEGLLTGTTDRIAGKFGQTPGKDYVVDPERGYIGKVTDEMTLGDTIGNAIGRVFGVSGDNAKVEDIYTGEQGYYSYGSGPFELFSDSGVYTPEEWQARNAPETFENGGGDDSTPTTTEKVQEDAVSETPEIPEDYKWWETNGGNRPTRLSDLTSVNRLYNPYLNPYYAALRGSYIKNPANPYVRAKAAEAAAKEPVKAYNGGFIKKMASGGVLEKGEVDVTNLLMRQDEIRKSPEKFLLNPARAANPHERNAIVDFNLMILAVGDGKLELPRMPAPQVSPEVVAQQTGQVAAQETMQNMGYATGGPVQPQEASQQQAVGPAGFVGGQAPEATPDAATVADDVKMEVPEGTFVLNAAAVEVAGSADVKKMLLDAIGEAKRQGLDMPTSGSKIDEEKAVSVLVSRGEVVIPPELAQIIGYDRLEKINNRGVRESERRKQEAQQKQEAPQQPAMACGGEVDESNKLYDGGFAEKVADKLSYTYGEGQDTREAELQRIQRENPRSFPELQERNTDAKIEGLNRLQGYSEEILDKSPTPLLKFDRWLLDKAPMEYNVAYGTEDMDNVPVGDRYTGYIQRNAAGITEPDDRNMYMPGKAKQFDQVAMHETGHTAFPYKRGVLAEMASDMGLGEDRAHEENAVTALDLYRGLVNGDNKETKAAVGYLVMQKTGDYPDTPYVGDPQGLQQLKENALRYVYDISDKNSDIGMSDDDRQMLAMDIELTFEENADLVSQMADEYIAEQARKTGRYPDFYQK